MSDCKAASTSIASSPVLSTSCSDSLANPTPYRSLVGALQYATFTRPDITFAVNRVCQFMHNPSSAHFVAAKRILRYLKGSLDKGVLFSLVHLLSLHLQMLIGLVIRLIGSLLLVLPCFLAIILSHGYLRNNTRYLVRPQKLNITPLPLVLLNLPGFAKSFVILASILLPLLSCGVTTPVLWP